MQYAFVLFTAVAVGQTEPLGPGDHKRTLTVDEQKRVHWVHVPPKYDAKKPTSVVLALHGALMDAKMMQYFTSLNITSDARNFIVVYPNGTGGLIQTWNAGLFPGELSKSRPDDVKYLGKVLDDVIDTFNVDQKRIYATGMSNGGMMCYRLASEMSDRIAAIAPVAGTIAVEKYAPKRPMPVVHFHGTKDPLVPFHGVDKKSDANKVLKFRSVDDTIAACIKVNGCADTPTETEPETKIDKLKIVCKEYEGKAAVVLYIIENGGHSWPGSLLTPAFLGPSTRNISANEIMWEFFQKQTRE